MSNDVKRKYGIKHLIDWSRDHCCFCTFPLEINPPFYDADEKTMSYVDFIIFKEHKFLRNIFSSEELAKTDSMKRVKRFHENFVRFLNIAIFFCKTLLILVMNLISASMTIYLIFVTIIARIVLISVNLKI